MADKKTEKKPERKDVTIEVPVIPIVIKTK